MTVLAVGDGRLPILGCLCVSTVGIGGLRVGMALSAGDLLRRSLMGQALYVFVAIHAAEHRAVDGMLQLVFVNIQADFPAVHVFRQCRIGVTGETVFVLELVLGTGFPRTNE